MNYKEIFKTIRPLRGEFKNMFVMGVIMGIMKSERLASFQKLDDIAEVLEIYEKGQLEQ